MQWLKAGILIYEAIARTVDRIGPVSFEPMEKHPPPRYDKDELEGDLPDASDVAPEEESPDGE